MPATSHVLPQGPFEGPDLPALRLSRRQLARLLACGELLQPVRGVYLMAELADDVWARAAALARRLPPGAAVARGTAAWLHGVDARPPSAVHLPPALECLVPVGATPPRRPGVSPRQGVLTPDDVVLVRGVPVTTPERTALDLARFSSPHMGLAVLDAMANAGLVRPDDLAARIEEWAGERFTDRARRLIQLCEPLAESFGESWARLRVVDAGFPRPEPQIWVYDVDGRPLYRLDMGWRERRVAVEYDGVEFHSSPTARAADQQRRDRLAVEHGWTVVGVGRGEVLGRSLAFERGVGHLLSMRPLIARRTW